MAVRGCPISELTKHTDLKILFGHAVSSLEYEVLSGVCVFSMRYLLILSARLQAVYHANLPESAQSLVYDLGMILNVTELQGKYCSTYRTSWLRESERRGLPRLDLSVFHEHEIREAAHRPQGWLPVHCSHDVCIN